MTSHKFILKLDDADILQRDIPSMNPNKARVVTNYIQCWRKMVKRLTRKTTVSFLRTPDLTLPNLNMNYIAGTGQMKKGNYIFIPNQTYVDFASQHLGGGVLRNGFVQEEFIMCQTTILPYLHKISGCDTMFGDSGSIIMDTHVFVDIDPSLYGNGLAKVKVTTIDDKVGLMSDPIPIVFVAMPAPRNPSYSRGLVTTMLARAYTSFVGAYKHHISTRGSDVPFVLNTGMWGCGVYHNDPRIVYSVQMYAWCCLIQEYGHEFKHRPQLVYHLSNLESVEYELLELDKSMMNKNFDQILTLLKVFAS